MGLCASSPHRKASRVGGVPAQLSQERVVAFRSSLQRKLSLFDDDDAGNERARRARGGTWMSVVVRPWDRAEGIALHRTFSPSREEIITAYNGGDMKLSGGRRYSYGTSFVLCSKHHKDVQSSLLAVRHDLAPAPPSAGPAAEPPANVYEGTAAAAAPVSVYEVVWLATRRKYEGQGHGVSLLRELLSLALVDGVSAVLVTANVASVGWWLSLAVDRCPWLVCKGPLLDSLVARARGGDGSGSGSGSGSGPTSGGGGGNGSTNNGPAPCSPLPGSERVPGGSARTRSSVRRQQQEWPRAELARESGPRLRPA